MHIPDGFLDTKTLATTAVLSAAGLGRAVRKAGAMLPRRKIPLMGLSASFIFAGQMLNFPIAGGTSGHLIGGVLAAVLLGPEAAVIVMSTVLTVQCFVFADGGVLALGANILNMAVAAPLCGYGVFLVVKKVLPGKTGTYAGAMFAGWASVVISSAVCAGELAWSGAAPWGLAFPAMTGIHFLIGLGEGLITALVLAAVMATRPELLGMAGGREDHLRGGDKWVYGAILVIMVLLFIAPWASPLPDGLEKVAVTLGFESRAMGASPVTAWLGEYRIPGLGGTGIIVAGGIGAILVMGLSYAVARTLAKRDERMADR